MKKKKLLKKILFITLIATIIEIMFFNHSATTITNFLNAKIDTKQEIEIDVGEDDVDIEIDIGNKYYEYLVGEAIDIGPKSIKTKGIITTGNHPDKLIYQWIYLTRGRPSPFIDVEGQNAERLTYSSAELNHNGEYALKITCQRWDDEAKQYKMLTKSKQEIYGWGGYINIKVYPDLNAELVTDNQLVGDNENGYSISLNKEDQYKVNLNLYRYALERQLRKEQVQDENGNTVDKVIVEYKTTNKRETVNSKFEVKWTSSNADVVDVNESGNLTVKAYSGEPITISTQIVDKAGSNPNGRTQAGPSITVKIIEMPVQNIEIKLDDITLTEEEPLNMKVGESKTLTAIVTPEEASVKDVKWSVDSSSTNIVEIDENGKVTALQEGDAIVIAESSKVQAKCKIHVDKIPVSDIEIDRTTIYLWQNYEGNSTSEMQTSTVYAKVLPADATNKNLKWSIIGDANGVSIQDNKNGTATITAGLYKKGANTCTIKVESEDNENVSKEIKVIVLPDYRSISYPVSIEPDLTDLPADTVSEDGTVNIEVGKGLDLNLKLDPRDSDATYETIEWKVVENNPDIQGETVLSVDDKGYVTTANTGTAIVQMDVKCQNPDCPVHHATIKINVKPILPNEVKINGDKRIELLNHDSMQLSATVMPDETTYKTIKWTSSNDQLVTVSQDGTITAVGYVENEIVTITASCGGKSDTCEVIVKPIKIDYLELNQNTLRLKDNEVSDENKIVVSYYPEDADINELEWKIEDPSIIRIENDGKVIPLKAGETNVIISVKGDPNVKPVTCQVTVLPSSAQVTIYTVDQKGKFLPGFTLKLSKVNENGEEIEVNEISGNGKFDFGVLPDGKYIVSEIVVPNKDVEGNDINIVDSIGFFHFEIEYGVIFFLNGDDFEYPTGGLVIVNIIDYPNEDEEEANAYVEGGDLFTIDEKTIEEQYIEFENSNFTKQPEEHEDLIENKDDTNQSSNQPKTSDIPIEIFTIAMVVSLVEIIILARKKTKLRKRK